MQHCDGHTMSFASYQSVVDIIVRVAVVASIVVTHVRVSVLATHTHMHHHQHTYVVSDTASSMFCHLCRRTRGRCVTYTVCQKHIPTL